MPRRTHKLPLGETRVYMWIPPGGCTCLAAHEMPEGCKTKPWRVWTMPRHMDPKVPPPPSLPLVHLETGFMEDYVHDWNWSSQDPTKLRFYSRVIGEKEGVWIALLFNEGPVTPHPECKRCKRQESPGANFCSKCGQKL